MIKCFEFVSIFSYRNIANINFLLKTKLEVGLLALGQSRVALPGLSAVLLPWPFECWDYKHAVMSRKQNVKRILIQCSQKT